MLHLDVRWPRVPSLLSLSVEDVILPYLGCVQGLYVMPNPAIPSFPRREVASTILQKWWTFAGVNMLATGWNGLKCAFVKVISYAHQEGSTQND